MNDKYPEPARPVWSKYLSRVEVPKCEMCKTADAAGISVDMAPIKKRRDWYVCEECFKKNEDTKFLYLHSFTRVDESMFGRKYDTIWHWVPVVSNQYHPDGDRWVLRDGYRNLYRNGEPYGYIVSTGSQWYYYRFIGDRTVWKGEAMFQGSAMAGLMGSWPLGSTTEKK